MPAKKGDSVLIIVLDKYTNNIDLHLLFPDGLKREDKSGFAFIATFIEQDDFGNMWLKGNSDGQDFELMIPKDMVVVMFLKPSDAIKEKMGFNI